MKPEDHLRANEIRAEISGIRRSIEMFSAKDHVICRYLDDARNLEIRERIVDHLMRKTEQLTKEYESL